MARKTKRPADARVKATTPAPSADGEGRRQTTRLEQRSNGLHRYEVISAVCNLFCQGRKASEVRKKMEEAFGVKLNREEPYQIFARAASLGYMRFAAPPELVMENRIRERCDWLRGVHVVHSPVFEDVGYRGADTLLQLLRRRCRPPHANSEVVHVGFAGGHAMRLVARLFAQLLRQPTEGLPRRIVLHAMAAGFDVYDPTTAPSSFFGYLSVRDADPAMQADVEFVGMNAPALVRADQLEELKQWDGIRESYEEARKLDVIVTSGSEFSDKDSLVRRYMERSPESFEQLRKAGCVGDILWRPVGRDGPIELQTAIRAMTLMELSELPRFIAGGGHVLLTLGPCMGCRKPKPQLLKVLLNMRQPLITHLVTDSRTAAGAL